ncbi:DUF6790 family protein [Devosia sp.]|uniref:DUF6790 family protein n=1 Tax=Devosia sp. TaxID=1871048 RepID=UPI002AFF9787|nr:DUF6790 family protein [Devosia sp.]
MGFIFVVASIAAALIHLAIRRSKDRAEIIDIFLLHSLVFNVGFVGLFFGFIPHVFFADYAAQIIGWETGSRFQYEVGFHDGAWGILGLLCIWNRDRFWLATGLGWSFFMLGAAYGHLLDTVQNANYAHNNFFMIFVDALIAALLLGLLALRYWHATRKAASAT